MKGKNITPQDISLEEKYQLKQNNMKQNFLNQRFSTEARTIKKLINTYHNINKDLTGYREHFLIKKNEPTMHRAQWIPLCKPTLYILWRSYIILPKIRI